MPRLQLRFRHAQVHEVIRSRAEAARLWEMPLMSSKTLLGKS
jgi:hypothetical protein